MNTSVKLVDNQETVNDELVDTPSFGERLERVREHFGFNIQNFASALDVSRTTIYEWREAESPTKRALGAIVAAFPSIDVHWLNTGEGEMLASERRANAEDVEPRTGALDVAPSNHDTLTHYHSVRSVTVYEPTGVEVSAGNGGLIPIDELAKTRVEIPSFILYRMLGTSTLPSTINAMVVRGKSMVPEVDDGDIILFEHCEEIVDAGRYIIQIDGGITLKKVQRRAGRVYRIIPANPDYDSEDIQQQGDTWVSLDSGANFTFGVVGRFLGVLKPHELDAPLKSVLVYLAKQGYLQK